MHLSTALGKVLSTKQEYLDVLESMGMKTVEDLLLYFPRGYEDLSDVRTLFDAPINQKVTLAHANHG